MTSAQELERDLEKAGFTVVDRRSKRNRKTSIVDPSPETPALRADASALPAIVPEPQADTLALPAIVTAPQGKEVVSPADELARLRANDKVLNARLAKAKVDLAELQKLIEITAMELIINNGRVTTALQELELHDLQNKPVVPSVPASAPMPAKSFSSVTSQLPSSNESQKSTYDTPKQSTKEAKGLSLKDLVVEMKRAGGHPYHKDPDALEYILSDIAPEHLCNDAIHATRDFIDTLSRLRLPQETLTQICTSVSMNHFTDRPFIKLMAWFDRLSGRYTVTMLVFPRQ
jgi:hypothetical protein